VYNELVRVPCVFVLVVALCGVAHAERARGGKRIVDYAGKVVISPDPPPSAASELPAYLAGNATKDDHYELIGGPPWSMHLVAVLAKEPGAKPVTLVIADPTDPSLPPLVSIELTSKRRIVIAHSEATIAAGFAPDKTYAVRVVIGKAVLARAELRLRD
jgi:hypothetical protein